MNHFNFFANLSPEKKSSSGSAIAAALIGCAILVVGGMYLNAKIKNTNVQKQLDYLTSVEQNPLFIQRNNMNNELNKKLISASDNYLFLSTADQFAGLATTADKETVEKLFSFFPEGTKIFRFSIEMKSVTINGVADSIETMTEVEKKLNESGLYSNVYINSAREDSHLVDNGPDAVSFSCKLTLSDKGGETK